MRQKDNLALITDACSKRPGKRCKIDEIEKDESCSLVPRSRYHVIQKSRLPLRLVGPTPETLPEAREKPLIVIE